MPPEREKAADHRDIDTVEYAYLEGLEVPVVEQKSMFNRLALRIASTTRSPSKPLNTAEFKNTTARKFR